MNRGRIIFVIGVSGSGKWTIAKGLADANGAVFLEGDEFHPPENVAVMASGRPLTDEMRWGWLHSLASAADEHAKTGSLVLVSCSGLKRAHRDALRKVAAPCEFLFLQGAQEIISARMRARKNHYMPASLLDSQFEALEIPDSSETDVETVSISDTPETIIHQAQMILFFPR